ncbi:hypothetical protein JCM10213_005635 [Rhodosporidiobolus nylandii]
MAGNGNSGGKGKKGGNKGGKDGRSKGAIYSSKRPVGGKGIFITCVRGKESRCVSEMYDLLEEIADKVYPPERVAKMVAEREAQRKEKDGAVEGEGEDEAMEAEGEEKPAVEAAPEPPAAEEEEDDEDDIEAAMEKEMAALKAGGGGGRGTAPPKKASADAKGKQKERPRFQSIQTDTECLCFIATAWPYDPVELTEAIVKQVQDTGVSQTRVTQRLSPISFSCHSLSVDQVEAQSSRLIEQAFVSWAEKNGTESVTYAIEPSLRSHTQPLNRSLLLTLLGQQISKLSNPPTVSSPLPDRGLLTVKADLKNPDLVLLPTVLKNVYGLSVVEGKMWRGKKFNLETIAQEVRKRKLEEEEEQKKRAKMDEEGAKGEEPAAQEEKKE